MLGDKKPEISPLARAVPDDFYFVQFRSLGKLVDLMDNGDLWGRHLFSQSVQTARTQMAGERIKAQLAVEVHPVLRPFYNTVVTDVAVTGSDLFLREGTDVTLLFRFRQPVVFKTQMDAFLGSAQKAHPDARRSTGEYRGVSYVKLASADRAVHVFSAYPQDDLHVRTNSEAGPAPRDRCHTGNRCCRARKSPGSVTRPSLPTSARCCPKAPTRKTAWCICPTRSFGIWSGRN